MSYVFECPFCEKECEVESGDLPPAACDDMRYECQHCNGEMTIGWFAEVEVRSVSVCAGDLS